MTFTQTEQQKEKRISKSKDTLRDLRENIKQNNICTIGVSRRRRERKSTRKLN